ncbi:MAG: response regulator transcription factor [Chloroflexi bacterium]|nr:response regulator transcription factor [Chloroflexota bacterium]
MRKISVLVADDHPTFQEGLCHFLEREKDIEVVARPADGEEAVRLAKELLPDVAILDVVMPRVNGMDAAKQIKAACPNTAILIVSAYNYESYLLTSMRVGAAGYLLKNSPVSQLVNAVRSVRNGEAVFDLKAISKVLSRLATEPGKENKTLKDLHAREVQILKVCAKGLSNRQIAEELGIGERTVQTHMFNIFNKLEVGSRTEAVLRALREGWLTLDDLP